MTRRILLTVTSGLLLVLAQQPFGLGLLAWVALVPLLVAIDGTNRRQTFALGFASGFVFFLGTVYWVVNSMYFYGGVGLWVSVPIMLLMVAYLALYTGAFALLVRGVNGGLVSLILIPSAWVALEYLRGRLFSGFPWVLAGYSQTPYLPVIQIADIAGVWGVSFIILLFNAGVFLYLRRAPERGHVRSKPVKELTVAVAIVAAALAYGEARIVRVRADVAGWKPLTASVAQGDVDQSLKWNAAFRENTLDIYRDLSIEASKKSPDLIVWPETAVPFYLGSDAPRRVLVEDIAERTGSYILTGSPSYTYNRGSGAVEYYNSAYLVSPDPAKGMVGKYDKVHLVPFGEYVPYKNVLFFVKKLTAGIGDFSSGGVPVPVDFEGSRIGVLICFEAIFPEVAREEAERGAGLLVNLTNDAWFGRSSAPYQHFAMSVMRAVENRTYLVRAANTGISAVVDPTGRVVEKTPLFERAVITNTLGLSPGPSTLYTAYGDTLAYLSIAFTVLVTVLTGKRRSFKDV